MAIGINLTDNVKISLGEIKEFMFRDLDENGIAYEIPFDKLNKNNVKETLVHIKKANTEISIENDIVTYIKSGNTEYTCIDTIKNIDENALEFVKSIIEKINAIFGNDKYTVKIEKIDISNMNITLILKSETEKARIHILRDAHGAVFINTVRSITYEV